MYQASLELVVILLRLTSRFWDYKLAAMLGTRACVLSDLVTGLFMVSGGTAGT